MWSNIKLTNRQEWIKVQTVWCLQSLLRQGPYQQAWRLVQGNKALHSAMLLSPLWTSYKIWSPVHLFTWGPKNSSPTQHYSRTTISPLQQPHTHSPPITVPTQTNRYSIAHFTQYATSAQAALQTLLPMTHAAAAKLSHPANYLGFPSTQAISPGCH